MSNKISERRERVKMIIQKHGGPSKIAHNSGISRYTLYSVMYGRRNPGAKTCLALSKALDIPFEYLYHGEQQGSFEPQAPKPLAASVTRTLSDSDWIEVMCTYIDQLKGISREEAETWKAMERRMGADPKRRAQILSFFLELEIEDRREHHNPKKGLDK